MVTCRYSLRRWQGVGRREGLGLWLSCRLLLPSTTLLDVLLVDFPQRSLCFQVDWIPSHGSQNILTHGGPHRLMDRASPGSDFSWTWLSHTQSLHLEPLGSGRRAGCLWMGQPAGQPSGLLRPVVSLSRTLQKKAAWRTHSRALPLQRTLSTIDSHPAFLLNNTALCLLMPLLLTACCSPLPTATCSWCSHAGHRS